MGAVRSAPYIDESPAETRVDRLSSVALGLAIVPWLVCGLAVLAVATGHRPPAALLAPTWLLGFFVGLTGAFIGMGLSDGRARAAKWLGFMAPLVTVVPTGVLCLYGMDWCC